jgi:peptide-methionine (R)-S-oxide reductase
MRKDEFTDEKLRKKLDGKSYRVMRKGETEPAFSSKLLHNKEKGIYLCKVCRKALFSSKDKFNSGTGWPSFFKGKNIELKEDRSHGMIRTEVICKKCKSHLGHVFDEPTPSGKRFCINGVALNFKKS